MSSPQNMMESAIHHYLDTRGYDDITFQARGLDCDVKLCIAGYHQMKPEHLMELNEKMQCTIEEVVFEFEDQLDNYVYYINWTQ